MRPFNLTHATSGAEAIQAIRAGATTDRAAERPQQFLAGGTTLIDLMKLDVMRPETLVDVSRLQDGGANQISFTNGVLRLGAAVKMSAAADHNDVKTNYPVIAETLALAASAQLRNMASLGGNVLQRTRCNYFRDTTYAECNKRTPGSGCAAMGGVNRMHAILGTSNDCIATYPGDFAAALIALDAQVEIAGSRGTVKKSFAQIHVEPGNTPHIETTLAPDDLIVAFEIPALGFGKRSRYVKVRDRQSYEFALASAAVALDIDKASGTVKDARIALGGVATRPWRAQAAENALKGKKLDDTSATAAANAAFQDAKAHGQNDYKIALGKSTLVRALYETAAMEA
jgi:xanthine dehydrogenase YagS FAD-binding subunit